MAAERRKCLFADEVQSKIVTNFVVKNVTISYQNKARRIFRNYSEESCLFECRLEHAAREAGCVPWDYPHPYGSKPDEFPICVATSNITLNKLAKFEALMGSEDGLRDCHCLPNCEEVTFKTQVILNCIKSTKYVIRYSIRL